MPLPNDKQKFALWVQPETLKKVEKLYRDDDCKSRSEFIEKAILFYAGYLTASDYRVYFPNVIVSTVKGTLDSLENRMASLLFKLAVELSMNLHVTAANSEIDADTLRLPSTESKKSCKRDRGRAGQGQPHRRPVRPVV